MEIKQQRRVLSASIFNWRVGQALARQAITKTTRLRDPQQIRIPETMPKGHYKHTQVNSNAIQAINKAYSNEIQGYKDFALDRRNKRRYNIIEISNAMRGIIDYIVECISESKPATIAGCILASGTNKSFYYAARAGEYDYITYEYIANNNIDVTQCNTNKHGLIVYEDSQNNEIILSPCSEIIEKCLLIIEDDLQQRTLNDKSMARTTGAIFNLKAVFNYNDKPEETKNVTNNTLIVNASPEQANKAMQLLLKDK